jgi:hypothetical protein
VGLWDKSLGDALYAVGALFAGLLASRARCATR